MSFVLHSVSDVLKFIESLISYLQFVIGFTLEILKRHNNVLAYNSIVVKNKLPSPHGAQSEEQFIGYCMSNTSVQSEFPDEKQRAAVCYSQWREHHGATNSERTDLQKIRTGEFVAPIIRAGVLYYKPGELQGGSSMSREGARVYYHPDSLKDPEFLDTVKRSAVNVGTHEANTSEYNRGPDGWIVDAWYDDAAKAVMAKGIVHGADNVKYVEQNKNRPEFGTSAYIDFLGVKKEKGTSTDGEEYDAVTTKLVNNHLAILPNIRDKKNVILAFNALNEEGEKSEENMAINKEELKNALEDMKKEDAQNASYEEMRNSIKNTGERLDKIESFMASMAKNEESKEDKKEDEKKDEAKNEDTKEEKKDEKEEAKNGDDENFNAKNARPSQDVVKAFSDHLGVTWDKTPSFIALAKAAGLTAATTEDAIAAVNAKRKEFGNDSFAITSEKTSSSFDEFLKST